jgi:protein-S-isoprenylcysteine O-methyltransferase Ste14
MVALIVSLIYSIFLPLHLNTIWLYIGLLIFLFGLIFDLVTLYTLRDAKLNRPFTTGPYRYSRLPLYVGLFSIYISISIMRMSWIFLVITIIHAIHLLSIIPGEEQYCLKTYGKEYQEYMKRTPRWIEFSQSGLKE